MRLCVFHLSSLTHGTVTTEPSMSTASTVPTVPFCAHRIYCTHCAHFAARDTYPYQRYSTSMRPKRSSKLWK